MTYDRLYKVFLEQFAIVGLTMDQIGKLLNLIGALYLASKKKNENLILYDFLYEKILIVQILSEDGGKFIKTRPPKGSMDDLILPICLNMDLYLTQGFKPSSLGIKDPKEVVKIINEIVNDRIPF